MKSVALYGFAEATRDGIWQSEADEIWSITWAYKYNLPRIDRIIEMHPIWMQAASEKPEYEKPRNHWKWMQENVSIPLYLLMERQEVPMGIRYPIEDVMAMLPQARRKKVFSSSFDYLMGLAIYEGFEQIECYGFEMGSDTEYRYQREGAAYWIGYCDAKGIELILPENTALLRNKMYGYQGGSMIYRQDIERLKQARQQQKVEAHARLSYFEGQMKLAVEKYGENSQEAQDIAKKWQDQYELTLVIHGALQENEYLLKEIDLEEPSEELTNPMMRIPV